MPVLNPAELWRETGRYGVDNLFQLEDSSGKQYVLAMTHEECFTFHAAREIRSYRELPQIWYQIQTKERDEPRPKSGILRTREFMMKDSYSFDRDDDGLDESYDQHVEVYQRASSSAAGCDLDGRVGHRHDGRQVGAHEFMAPSPAGEDRAGAVLELRLRREPRGGALDAADAGVSRRPGCAAGGRDARGHHHRGAGRVPGRRPGRDRQGDAGGGRTARSSSRWCAATTGCTS